MSSLGICNKFLSSFIIHPNKTFHQSIRAENIGCPPVVKWETNPLLLASTVQHSKMETNWRSGSFVSICILSSINQRLTWIGAVQFIPFGCVRLQQMKIESCVQAYYLDPLLLKIKYSQPSTKLQSKCTISSNRTNNFCYFILLPIG